MLTRIRYLPVFFGFCALAWPCTVIAQQSVIEFQRMLRERAGFEETALAELGRGQPIVKLVPALDKREVAVCGLVSLRADALEFLTSFQENMTRKTNPAILEIGSFASIPTLDDLRALTIETRDIEDMKECIVGDCEIKLSSAMIERFRKEMNWESPDYEREAARLIKVMLLEYVRDYLERGDAALIEYNDKENAVRLRDEHRALKTAPGYLNDILHDPNLKDSGPGLQLLQDAIVWSKIKFGLKPVIAINHIRIYRREREFGPQVLVASKQIYANHYFNSSLALTAFVTIPGSTPTSYLIYENRSRTDGLEGPLGKMKRRVVENKAVDSLQSILLHSKASFEIQATARAEAALSSSGGVTWSAWRRRIKYLSLSLLMVTVFVTFFALRRYEWYRLARRGEALTQETK